MRAKTSRMLKGSSFEQCGLALRLAFIEFVNETGFDLVKVCERLQEKMPGYSPKNVAKWLPSKADSVTQEKKSIPPITGKQQLDKLFEYIKTCLKSDGYTLTNINKDEVNAIESPDNLPFYDAVAKRFYYKKAASADAIAIPHAVKTFENKYQYSSKWLLIYHVAGGIANKYFLYLNTDNNKAYLLQEGSDNIIEGCCRIIGETTFVDLNFHDWERSWQVIFQQHETDNILLAGVYSGIDINGMPVCGKALLVNYSNYPTNHQVIINEIAAFALDATKKELKHGNYIISKELNGLKEPLLVFNSFHVINE